jgi:hypothetical protein
MTSGIYTLFFDPSNSVVIGGRLTGSRVGTVASPVEIGTLTGVAAGNQLIVNRP